MPLDDADEPDEEVDDVLEAEVLEAEVLEAEVLELVVLDDDVVELEVVEAEVVEAAPPTPVDPPFDPPAPPTPFDPPVPLLDDARVELLDEVLLPHASCAASTPTKAMTLKSR